MTDVLGYRLKVGVVTPSVNTVVQPEMEALRPDGVTNHLSRIFTRNVVTQTDDSFDESVHEIDKGVDDAVESILTCEPDVIVLGVSMEAIYGDPDAGDAVRDRIRRKLDLPDLELIHAGAAIPAALRALGISSGSVSILGPYGPAGEPHLTSFMNKCGYSVHTFGHIISDNLVKIAHNPFEVTQAAFEKLAADKPDAIVQFGANLPAASSAAHVEQDLDIPIVPVNTATYWHALRSSGITDRKQGHGRLFADH
jgi:maleate isomerase